MNPEEHPEHAHHQHTTRPQSGLRSPNDRHAGHDLEAVRRKFWVALILSIPVVAYSEGIREMTRLEPPKFPGSEFVPFVFGTGVFFYGGIFFIRGAVNELRERVPGMMTLISMAITVAFLYSLAVTFGLSGDALYWELSTLIVVMLFGHWTEMKAVGKARGALSELARLVPDKAERITGDRTETVMTSELRQGDAVLIRPGARIPADGVVEGGESTVNEAMITGESRPVVKTVGSRVIAGTINGAGSMRVRVTDVGEETVLAGIMRLVTEAQHSRSMAQNLADRAAYWLTLVAISAGALTLVVWLGSGSSFEFALSRFVTVLVIACPHALGLAIPLVVAISTAMAAQSGLLVRDRLALEAAKDLDVVMFDKTGTLTKGEHGVVGIYVTAGTSENEALALAAAAERDSEHMLALAIVCSADERGIKPPEADGFKAIPGHGVEANVGERKVSVGGPRLLEAYGLEEPAELADRLNRARSAGQTLVYLIDEGMVRAVFALADVIRPESREAVLALKRMGIQVAMMTGDSEDVARWVANELGIAEYYSGVLPEEKAMKVREIRRQGRHVAMVGDGVNDAPALASADVGIAIGAGTDVAVESGGVILIRNDPRDVSKVIRLSKASYRKMVQNLLWATGYNVVALPLAAGVLAGEGVILPPAVGALFMTASTVVVAVNAQLLRRLRL